MTQEELGKIYNEAYKSVYWTAFNLLKNESDAEDIVQDTFVSFIESYSSITDTDKVVPLLKKIAANKCLNKIKLNKTDAVENEFFEDVEALPEDFLPDTIIESEEMRQVVMNIINDTLSDDIRRTLVLFYFDDMSTKEIAEAMGIPQGTVLWRLSFAKKKIKKEVEKYEEERNTKLFGMAIPFLTKLFIKEAERVVLKPMSANLMNLSASSQAPISGANTNVAASAAKKGLGIMKGKIIIGVVAAVLVTGTVLGIVAGVSSRRANPAPSVPEYTMTVETSSPLVEPTKNDTLPTDESETKPTQSSQEITKDSIITNMDGMSAKECAENIWNASKVNVSMSKDEYAKNLIVADHYIKTHDDSFYWSFNRDIGSNIKNRITGIGVYAPIDKSTMTITEINKTSNVELMLQLTDLEFAKEVFDELIKKYEAIGCTIRNDTISDDSRLVEIDGSAIYKINYVNMGNYVNAAIMIQLYK